MGYDFSKLIGRMAEFKCTQKYLASKLGISNNAFSNKINGKSYFNASEISILCDILQIPPEMVGVYFFMKKVWKSKLNS